MAGRGVICRHGYGDISHGYRHATKGKDMAGLTDEEKAALREQLSKKEYRPLTPEQRTVAAAFAGVVVFPESPNPTSGSSDKK
jgi:hypothetical protein